MATFTVELYKVAEMRGTIGLDDYPIFDPAYREQLNKKIYDHYIDHEIGMETVPKFLHAMQRKMNEIMPMYNQLYQSQKLVIDPLNTISMSTVVNGLGTQKGVSAGTTETTSENTTASTDASTSKTTNHGTSENSGRSSAAGQSVQSDFPQTQLQKNKDYATNGVSTTNEGATSAQGEDNSTSDVVNSGSGSVHNNGEGSSKDSSTSDLLSTDKTDSTVEGWSGSQAALLMQFRATFLNIDMDIINELASLFMWVWNNGDEYTTTSRNGIYY